jgi:cytochrome c oxidase assembly protein subunit 15
MPALPSQRTPWLQRFTWFTAATTLFLICSGGMVTSKGVGLAVPDWPSTFGYNMFLFPVSQWVGGVFFEHTHRLIASGVGFLTIILAVWLWRAESRKWVRMLGVIALGAVIVQGVLGGLRVTMLKDEIGIFHACLAQAFLGLLVFIGVVCSRRWLNATPRRRLQSSLLWLPVVTTIVIYLQLGLGATMRHQHRDLSILDFPAAYGRVIPDVSEASLASINQWREARALSEVNAGHIWLQMAHRFVALIISAGVIAYWVAMMRQRVEDSSGMLRALSSLWLFFLACQVTLGAWTIWSNKAADVATAHVAVGATMLALGITISAFAARLRTASEQATSRPPNTPVLQAAGAR